MTTNQTIDGVPRADLKEIYAQMVDYWDRIDGEWGSCGMTVDEAMDKGDLPALAKLRALLDAPIPFPGYPPVPEDRKLPAAQPDEQSPSEDELVASGLGYPFSKEDAVQLWYSGFKTEPITVLEAWDAIGHDIGCNPSKEELLDSLRNMAAICDAHGNDMPAAQPQGEPFGYWLSPCNLPAHGVFHRATEETTIVDGLSSVGGFDVVALYTEQPAPVAVDETAEFSKWTHEVIAESRIGGVTLKVQRMQHMTPGEEAAAFEAWKYRANLAPLAGIVLPEREALRDIIAQAISGDTYDCTRAWSAWGVGTMSEDDFVSVVDQESRLYEIADACLDEVTRLNGVKPLRADHAKPA